MTKDGLIFLEQKLSAASGGSRELDAAIFNAMPPADYRNEVAYQESSCIKLREFGREVRFHDGWLTRRTDCEDDKYPNDLPRLTTSLDAAVAIIARVRPEAEIELDALRRGAGVKSASAKLWSTKPTIQFGEPKPLGFARADTAPLALCLALIRSLVKEKTDSLERLGPGR